VTALPAWPPSVEPNVPSSVPNPKAGGSPTTSSTGPAGRLPGYHPLVPRPAQGRPGGPGRRTRPADPADVKGRSLARLDLAQAYVQDRAVEEACAAVAATLDIRHENRVGPILCRVREVRATLEPWRDERPVKELDEQLRPLLSA
jgi:hypothetical protein